MLRILVSTGYAPHGDHMPTLAGVAAAVQKNARADRHPLHQRCAIGGEPRELYAPWATEDVPRMAMHAMNTFSPALGVDLALDDHGYALAALSWWWSTRCAPRGLC